MNRQLSHKKRGAIKSMAEATKAMKEKVDALHEAAQAATTAIYFGQELIDLRKAYVELGSLDSVSRKQAMFLGFHMPPDEFLALHTLS